MRVRVRMPQLDLHGLIIPLHGVEIVELMLVLLIILLALM